jgi:hypothetical protein
VQSYLVLFGLCTGHIIFKATTHKGSVVVDDISDASLASAKSDYKEIKPDGLPQVIKLSVACPCCNVAIEYEPDEDDSGAWGPTIDWPVCDDCEVLIDVLPIRLVKVDQMYFASQFNDT